MSIVRFSPWELDRSAAERSWVPAADVWETPSAYRIDLEIPSVPAENVEVAVENGILVVSGERKHAENGEEDRALRLERRQGRFSRRFRLPKDVDHSAIEARMEQGVLALTVAKKARPEPRRIEVVAA